ncbi:hypothetical protein BH09PSE6_BH09PSE6_07270 [soil metagenome]
MAEARAAGDVEVDRNMFSTRLAFSGDLANLEGYEPTDHEWRAVVELVEMLGPEIEAVADSLIQQTLTSKSITRQRRTPPYRPMSFPSIGPVLKYVVVTEK